MPVTIKRAGPVLLLAALYYIGARVGLALGALPGNVSAVWPPTGLALAAVVLFGPRAAPGVFLGAFAANYASLPHAAALGMAVGNTAEALVGAAAFRRVVGPDHTMTRVTHVLGFAVFVATGATAISAAVGVGSLILTGAIPVTAWLAVGKVWWVGDALGALVVGAALLTWARPTGRPRGGVLEATALATLTAAVGVFVFSTPSPRAYMLFPFVIWATLRFAGRGATATTLIVAAVSIARTAAGAGPFVRGTTASSLWSLNMYLAVIALTGLLLAVVVAERDDATAAVRSLSDQLQHKIDDLRAQQSLRDAQRLSKVGFWRLDRATRALEWSDVLYELYGLDPATFTPTVESFMELVHPDDRDAVRRGVVDAFVTGEAWTGDIRVLHSSGEERILWGEAEAEFDANGEVAVLRGVRQDVTELRRNAARLREAEERFRMSFDGAPIGISLLALDGTFMRANPALCAVLGYDEEELRTKTFADITHPDDVEADREFMRQLLAGERASYEMEKRYLDARGRVVWVQLNGSLVRDANGNPSHFIKQIQDITSRRATEAQLRESEQRFRRLAAGAPLGIFQTDSYGRIVYANQTWSATCVADADALRGAVWTTVVDDVERGEVETAWANARHASTTLEVRFRVNRANVSRWVDVRLQPMARDGGASAWVGTATDVTALVDAHEAIRDARDRALRASEMKSQFLANMSHEIRTPMNGVVGMADLLADSPLSPAQRDHVSALRTAATSLLSLLNDILDLARIEAGKVTLESTEFRVADLVRETAALFAASAETKGIDLDYEVQPDADGWVRGDPTRLRQVLTNLVGNAVKFTERGGVNLRVRRERDGALRFDVADTGIGIPAGHQARLMTPFEQGDPSTTRRFGGSGLGLAISQELVAIMGGHLEFTSAVGTGTTMTVRVPLVPVDAPLDSVPAPAPAYPSPPAESIGRALLAEDNVINQRVARSMLERLGWSVVVVDNGQAAVEQAATGDFDVVILDCQMPVLDGYAAAAAIRRLPGSEGAVRIIAMTASAYAEDRERCLAAGMDDYLSKPVTKDVLAEVLDRTGSVPSGRPGARRTDSVAG